MVGLGGNTAGTLPAFQRAYRALSALFGQCRRSSLYRTLPQGDADQALFWNAAVAGQWDGTPESLLERLLLLEASEGRERDPLRPKGPRVLDLDLLLCGDEIRSSPRLCLPHAGLAQRRFALEPLLELEPEARDPREGALWRNRLAILPDQGVDRQAQTW